MGGCVGPTAGLDTVIERNSQPLPGLETLINHPVAQTSSIQFISSHPIYLFIYLFIY
jgi:hypothetical protein